MQSGLKCEIKLKNTLVDGATETIGLFETDQWNYENDSKSVSVSLKDDLEEWQDINVGEISYDPRNPVSKPKIRETFTLNPFGIAKNKSCNSSTA